MSMPVALGKSRRVSLESGSGRGGNRHKDYGDSRKGAGGRLAAGRSNSRTGAPTSRMAKANSYLHKRQQAPSEGRVVNLNLSLPAFDPLLLGSALGSVFALAVGLAFMVVFSLGLLMGYRYVTSMDYFALRQVNIQGNQRLTQDEVRTCAGLDPDANALGVNIREVEQSLLANPWIEKAVVRRILPDKLQIQIGERQAAFWVKRNEALYYADNAGKIIAPVAPGRFASLPLLEITEDGQKHVKVLAELAELLEKNVLPFGVSQLALIRLSAKSGLEFALEGKDIVLSASLADWRENVIRLGKVWTDLQKRRELEGVAFIRAAGDQVMVEKRTEPRR